MGCPVSDSVSRLRSLPPRLLGFPCLLPCVHRFPVQGSKVLQFSAATICQARNEFNRAAALQFKGYVRVGEEAALSPDLRKGQAFPELRRQSRFGLRTFPDFKAILLASHRFSPLATYPGGW